MAMQRYNPAARGGSRPPSAPPTTGVKRKEREFEQETGDETNINVVVRCRGRSEREVRENSGVVVSTEGVKGKNVELYMGPNSVNKKTYNFDKVFSPAADQAVIFDDVVSPILSEMLGGFNCTIFAYGQTGTGKTYTMSGDMTETYGLLSDAAGIIPRVLQKLFQNLESDGVECSVKCSFIELYNEELRDLLATDDSVKLKIFDDANKKSHSATLVQGMEESHIKNAAAGIALLQKGSHRRQVAATKCNDLSSRSHTVFTITTYVKKSGETNEEYICSGKLNLVDLAGSENIQRSGAENKRAAEAGLINKSLLTLGRVINALVDKSAHIPYRESKLTRLLQDSLGGRTKTCIIATVSPARSNLEETISTLDYAFRAKNIRNKPQINSMISKKTLLREFTTEIEKLKTELIATRQRNGVYLTNDQFEEITVESESRRILSEEQKARIEAMEVSLRNKVQELFSLTTNFAMLKKDNDATHATLNSTKDVLEKTELVLKDAQSNLDEESKLRQRYAETESKLHEMGQGLLSTIGISLRDIDGLHAKLKRRSILHGQNKDAWQEIQSYGNKVLGAVDVRLHELKQQHEAQVQETSTRIEAYVASELERAQQTISLLSSSGDKLKQSIQDAEGRSSKARDEMNEVLEEIKVLRDDVKTRVGQGLNDLSDAAARISGEVIAELDQFHTQLHTSYAGLGKDFKNLFEDLTRQLANQREESDRLRKALQEANRKNIETSIATASHLEENLEAERRAAEEEKADMMQQVAMLLTSSMSRRDERLNKMMVASQAKIVEATEELELADKAYAEGMDRWAEQDTNLREKMSKSKEELKARLKNDWTAVDTRNSAIQDSTKAVHQETVKIVEAQVQAMDTQMAALDGFVIGAKEQNNMHHEKNAESLEAISKALTEDLTTIEGRVQRSEVEQFSSDIKQQLDESIGIFQSADASIYRPLSELKAEISQDLLVNYAPTGETPQRKQWDYPRTLPRTIPLPEEASTTPVSKPPNRSPGKTTSPRKFASPKKSPKKQLVHVDTPPRLRPTTTPAAEPHRPVTSSGLRDLDINLAATIPGPPLVRSASDTVASGTTLPVPNDKSSHHITVTTATYRVPTKSSSSKSLTDKENLTVPLSGKAGSRKAARVDVDDKENLTMPLAGASEKMGREKLSQSVFGGGARLTRSRTKGSPDFGRSVGV